MGEAVSPVRLRGAHGSTPVTIGRYPLLSEAEALAALDAATAAYQHGRGRWPTMAVAERIKHVEEFLRRFKA